MLNLLTDCNTLIFITFRIILQRIKTTAQKCYGTPPWGLSLVVIGFCGNEDNHMSSKQVEKIFLVKIKLILMVTKISRFEYIN